MGPAGLRVFRSLSGRHTGRLPGGVARLDFAKTEQARQTINAWVEEQTENKITDLIPPRALSADTKLVLTNAVYFHGDWQKPFAKAGTREQDFHLTNSDKQKVPLMHQSAAVRYGAVDDLKVLELPYGDGRLSMVVLLPNEIKGLGRLEAQFSSQKLQQWITSLHRVDKVEVYLPKFKTTSQFQLASTLSALGMPSAFNANTADFSGMTGGRDLCLSAVLHKAFVDVNEEGTEAAAATGAVAVPTAAIVPEPQAPPVFRADHPFLFLIRDHRTGAILFLGRISILNDRGWGGLGGGRADGESLARPGVVPIPALWLVELAFARPRLRRNTPLA